MIESTECNSPYWIKNNDRKVLVKCHRHTGHEGSHEWCTEWD